MKRLLVLLLSILIIAGCSNEPIDTEKRTVGEKKEDLQNQQVEEVSEAEEVPLFYSGNVVEGGKYAIIDDTLYFANIFDEDRLYKIKLGSQEPEKLTDHSITNMQVIDDWIVYIEKEGFFEETFLSLRKMKTDGSENEVMIDGPVGNVQVYGDELIFLKDDSIHKMKLTDDEPTKLPYDALDFSFYNGEIVFYDVSANYRLGNLNGDEPVDLFTSGNGTFIYDGEAIYFTKEASGEMGLFRYHLENGTEEQIIAERVDYFNIDEHSIYYSTAESEASRGIYKVSKNGENKQDFETILQTVHIIDRYLVGEYGRQGFGVIEIIDKDTMEVHEAISLHDLFGPGI